MYFEYPKLLWLLVIPVLLLGWYLWQALSGRRPHLRVPTATPWTLTGISPLAVLRHLPFVLRLAALSLIIICIARPRSSSQLEKVDTEGIDIVLAMDVSTSMLARDFSPDRILISPTTAGTTYIIKKKDESGVSLTLAGKNGLALWYDLNGHPVNEKNAHLSQGIYVSKGKKIAVR